MNINKWAELTPRQAEMLKLHISERKSMREIARELDVNVSTVSRTIARAKQRIGCGGG